MAKKKKKKNDSVKKNRENSSPNKLQGFADWSPFFEVVEISDERNKLISDLGKLSTDKLNSLQNYQWAVNTLMEGLSNSQEEMVAAAIERLDNTPEDDDLYLQSLSMLTWLSCFWSEVPQTTENLHKALNLAPESPQLKRYQTVLLMREGQNEKALDVMANLARSEKGEEQDRDIVDFIEAGSGFPQGSGFLFPSPDFGSFHHIKKAPDVYKIHLNILNKLIEREPDNSHHYFEASLHAFFLSDWQASEAYLNKLLDKFPDHIDGKALHGFVFEKKGDIEGALEKYQEVLSLNPRHPLANVNSGVCNRVKGNIIAAEYYFQKASEAAPEYPEALSQWARFLVHNESHSEKIIELHKKAITLEPEVSDYHLHYCLSILRLGDIGKLQSEWNLHKKYIQAFTENDNARRLISRVLGSSKDPMYDLGMAEMLNENGFSRPAREFIVKAWKRKYNIPTEKLKEFYYHTGVQAGTCEEHAISLAAFEGLQEMDSQNDSLSVYMAMAHTRLGQNSEALEILNHIKDDSGKLGVLKANVYWDLGNHQEAVDILQSVMATPGPTFLSFYYTVKYSLASGATSHLKEMFTKLKEIWKESPGFWALEAEYLLRSGQSSQALAGLKEKLYKDGTPHVPELNTQGGLENNLVEPFYILGCSYLKESAFDELENLLKWLEVNIAGAPEWEVLRAERFREDEQYAVALEKIFPTNRSLLACVTRALCLDAQGHLKEAENNARAALEIISKGKMYYHPCGDFENIMQEILKKAQDAPSIDKQDDRAEESLEGASTETHSV